jgi:hypothetical protein
MPRIKQMQKAFAAKDIDKDSVEKIQSFLTILAGIARRDGDLNASLNFEIQHWLERYRNQESETEVIHYYDWLKTWYAERAVSH